MDLFQLGGGNEELPEPIRDLMGKLRMTQTKADKARAIVRKSRGKLEADVLTPAFDAMRNDPNMSTHDTMAAIAAIYAIIKTYENDSNGLNWWATAHAAAVASDYLKAQAEDALAIAHTYEKLDPGSTTETGDMELPGGDA